MGKIDVFVVPSVLDSESFGVAAVEAAACGLPVVASRVGGLVEVVRDGETGFLVPPRDTESLVNKLTALIGSPDMRAQMGANGRALVEREYSWTTCMEKMSQIYESTIHSHCSAIASVPGLH
jgi:glycosyltransferase involved in cell wall biosynthesis